MSILVTGASGFLGGAVVSRLSGLGFSVIATGRNREKLNALSDDKTTCFAWDLSSNEKGPAGHEIDCIIHCAGLSSAVGQYQDFYSANVRATKNLLSYAQVYKPKRLIFISSPTLYFECKDKRMVAEESPLPKPINHYAATKKMAEDLVLEHAEFSPVILRPRGIYGPKDSTLLPSLIEVAKRQKLPLFRGGAAAIDLTHVDDVVDAIIQAIGAGDHVSGQIYNISGGEVLPIKHIVEKVCTATKTPLRWQKIPFWPVVMFVTFWEWLAEKTPLVTTPKITKYMLGLFAFHQSLDLRKAKKDLDWTPKIQFEQGINFLN